MLYLFNHHIANVGLITPQTDLIAVSSELLGVNRNALVTFPEYDGLQNGKFSQP